MRYPSHPALLGLACLLASCATPAPVGDALEDLPMFPEPPEPPRVQFLMSLGASDELESGPTGLDQFLFGDAARVSKPIMRPVGIGVRNKLVYILDAQLLLVHQIDIAKRKMDFVLFKGRGKLQIPMDMHLSDDGHAYIADRGRRQVVVYDKDWKYVRELGPWGKDSSPVGVSSHGDRVFVADSTARCLRVVDKNTGEQLGVLGADDKNRATSLRTPTSVAVDKEGHIYVVDAIYQRILAFDKDLNFVRQLGEPGDAPGFFGRPKAIAIHDRTVWVLDSLYENCQVMDMTGKPLLFFGGGGIGPGQLYLPRGLWIGDEGIELFRDRFQAGFEATQLIIATSLFGPRKVSFFALGKSTLPAFKSKYVDDSLLPPRPVPRGKEEHKPGEGLNKEVTAPQQRK